jgi:hypothetical protein
VADPIALFDPCTFAIPWSGDCPAVGFVDLDRTGGDMASFHPPPFPLLGIGNPAYPIAPQLDAVIEPPFTAAMIQQACDAQPDAAAILAQLLRLIEPLDVEPALVAESLAYAVLQGSSGHTRWLAAQQASAPMPSGEVRVDRQDGLLAITLDRPAAHNAIDRHMRDGLHEAFDLATLDPDIERVVLRGAGKSFSVGADLAEFGTTRDPAMAHGIRMLTLPAHAIARCRDRLEVHVQGGCVGSGLEMAAFARRLTASARAWFQLPELAMGVIAGAGGCVSVSRRIGRQRAALLMLSGKRISAEVALGWGLVDAIIDD